MLIKDGLTWRWRLDRLIVDFITPHPRKPFRTIGRYIVGLVWVGLLGNSVYDLAKGELRALLPLAVCVALVLLLVIYAILLYMPTPRRKPVDLAEVPPPPMKGLVLLLSSFSAKPGSSVRFVELITKASRTDEDWENLEQGVRESNFDVPLQAIRYHLRDDTLRHVWLICTDDARDERGEIIRDTNGNPVGPGSYQGAPLLEKFVREAPHARLTSSRERFAAARKVQFHYHSDKRPQPEYLVNPIGELGVRGVFRAVNHFFDHELELSGLDADSVICDLTGGRGPHTVGLVLACLPARRRIQYTSSLQLASGEYEGRPRPRELRIDSTWVSRLITLEDIILRIQEPTDE